MHGQPLAVQLLKPGDDGALTGAGIAMLTVAMDSRGGGLEPLPPSMTWAVQR